MENYLTSKTDILNRMDDFLSRSEAKLTALPSPSDANSYMKTSTLQNLRTRVDKLRQLLSKERLKLVFIGQVGSGKTTAICHIFGITRVVKKSSKRGTKVVTKEVIEPLMTTGSGSTTLCEVVVAGSHSTSITIEATDDEELISYIKDFCLSIWEKVYPDSTHESEGRVDIPRELARAIRNIVNLPDKGAADKDAAYNLALEHKGDQSGFIDSVVDRAQLANRNNKTLYFTAGTDGCVKDWVRKNYQELNLVKNPSFSLPKRIQLNLNMDDFPLLRGLYCEIIDTKGVDGAKFDRRDLDDYLRSNPDCICVLVDGFAHSPSAAVTTLMDRHLKQVDIANKLGLLVMYRGNEPEKLVGTDGAVDCRDEGVAIRRKQVEEEIVKYNFDERNLLVLDPMELFDEHKSGFVYADEIDEIDIAKHQKDIINKLEQIVITRSKVIEEEFETKEKKFYETLVAEGLSEADAELVDIAGGTIHTLTFLSFPQIARFFDEYCALWDHSNRHVMHLYATNNREGIYPFKDIDISYDGVPITETLLREATGKYKKEVVKTLEEVKRETSNQDLVSVMDMLLEDFQSWYEQFIINVAQAVESMLSDELINSTDPDFWPSVKDRFGRGEGYRHDVLMMYRSKIPEIENDIEHAACEKWREEVIKPTLLFLGAEI